MNTLKLKALNTLVAASLMALAGAASAQVVGGGATLPENLYNGTSPAFNNGILTGISGFNKYIGVGSGNGKKAFFGDDSDFFTVKNAAGDDVKVYDPKVRVHYAGSDSLLTIEDANGYENHATKGKATFGPLVQIPVALTSVTVPYNIPGLTKLNLTSDDLAKIFNRTYTNWKQVTVNKVGNVKVKGPDKPIKVIFRKGSSGTTEIFVRHLNTQVPVSGGVSSTFATAYGISETNPPLNFIAASGSQGIINAVKATPYSISYVSPEVVDIESAAEVAALYNTKLTGDKQDYLLPTVNNVKAVVKEIPRPSDNAKDNALNWGIGHGSTAQALAKPERGYPITGVTNLILSQCYSTGDASSKIRTFLANNYSESSAASANDAAIIAKNLVPLPTNWQNEVRSTFYEPTSPLAIGNTSVCAGYAGR